MFWDVLCYLALGKDKSNINFQFGAKYCFFHIFICASLSIQTNMWLKNLHLHVTLTQFNPSSAALLLLSQSFPISTRPWVKSLWLCLMLTNNNPFHCWIWAPEAVLYLITGLPWLYYFSIHFFRNITTFSFQKLIIFMIFATALNMHFFKQIMLDFARL